MTGQEVIFPKKRELGDIINDTFRFFRQEHRTLTRLLLIYVLPFALLYAFVQIYIQMKVMGNVDLSNPEDVFAKMGPIYRNLFIAMLFSLFVQSLLAGSFYSFVEVYIKKGRGNFTMEDISPLLFSNSLKALTASLLFFFIVVLGTFLCILPGIYFANIFSPVLMIVVFEKKGVANAFSRSWQLVNKQWGNTFMINIVGVLMVWAANFILSFPAVIAGVGGSFFRMNENPDFPEWYWVALGISSTITTMLYIIPYTFLAFHYFNLTGSAPTGGNVPVNLNDQ